jgi:exodeoxyribonuclease VII large subunit
MRSRMDLLRLVLDGADRHLEVRSPRRLLEGAAAELERLQGELHAAAGRRVGQLERELATAAEALDARSPLRVLSRGYALLVDDQSERAVRTPSDVEPGQRLRARLAEGELYVRAEGPVSAEAGQGGSHG